MTSTTRTCSGTLSQENEDEPQVLGGPRSPSAATPSKRCNDMTHDSQFSPDPRIGVA